MAFAITFDAPSCAVMSIVGSFFFVILCRFRVWSMFCNIVSIWSNPLELCLFICLSSPKAKENRGASKMSLLFKVEMNVKSAILSMTNDTTTALSISLPINKTIFPNKWKQSDYVPRGIYEWWIQTNICLRCQISSDFVIVCIMFSSQN